MKTYSIYFQLNVGIHLNKLDSSHSLSNGHNKNTDEQTQIEIVSQDDGAAFGAKISLNAEKEIFNCLLINGLPTTKMANVQL